MRAKDSHLGATKIRHQLTAHSGGVWPRGCHDAETLSLGSWLCRALDVLAELLAADLLEGA